MKLFRRWAAAAAAMALTASLLAGCGSSGAGIDLAVCAGGDVECLDPIYADASGDQTILMHLYENLMRVTADATGAVTVTTGVAKSVDQEENFDGTVTYTFHLRKTKWSDGRSVKASDFVYAWQRLADPANDSPYAELLSVVAGYAEARESGDLSLLQVSAKNDDTLTVVLNGKYDWFLSEVCTAPATLPLREDLVTAGEPADGAEPEETEDGGAESAPAWWEDVEGLVTNGPYQVTGYTPGQQLTAAASERYDGTAGGPASLTFRFAQTPEEAWELYEARSVDFVWELPAEQLEKQAAEDGGAVSPALDTTLVLYNCAQEVFTDPAVRQAMAQAVDRNAAAEAAGPTARAAEGLIPPGVAGGESGDFRTDNPCLDNDPQQYDQRCREARELLADAGYQGEALGELTCIYVDEGSAAAVAATLTAAWKQALDVRVTARSVTEEEFRTALEEGTYTLALADWPALGRDPECFLRPWSSQTGGNVIRYENSAYDTLLTIIASASDENARLGCLRDAEDLLLSDCGLSPLYTTVTDWELRDTLSGLARDARGWFLFTGVSERTA